MNKPMPVRIDAHHHFWKYRAEEYPWITKSMSKIRRDFLPEHLKQTIQAAGINAVVTVQARQTMEETSWLLELADQHDFIRGVVGWVPLVDASVATHLEEFAGRPKLKAVRHVLQDEPDDYVLREDFNRGIKLLERFTLVYDILIHKRHLPQTVEFVDRHPNQIFVLNHIAKPSIKDHSLSPWRENITHLGERENVFCKVSGMVTEADWQDWTASDLEPYFDIVLSAFGPKRLMFGSDWPVILVASEYRRWVDTVLKVTSKLSSSEKELIFGGTAIEAYNL